MNEIKRMLIGNGGTAGETPIGTPEKNEGHDAGHNRRETGGLPDTQSHVSTGIPLFDGQGIGLVE